MTMTATDFPSVLVRRQTTSGRIAMALGIILLLALVVSAALNNRNLGEMLSARGLDGWELVGFTRKDVAVFKRALR